ncbi:hypothetical protein ACVWYG_001299 [Pedobacter sp. UYEF25]
MLKIEGYIFSINALGVVVVYGHTKEISSKKLLQKTHPNDGFRKD